eukprot:1162064-Pelagomonas_calceolata.AAC.13
MIGWREGGKDGWVDGWREEWMDGWIIGWRERRMEEWTMRLLQSDHGRSTSNFGMHFELKDR